MSLKPKLLIQKYSIIVLRNKQKKGELFHPVEKTREKTRGDEKIISSGVENKSLCGVY